MSEAFTLYLYVYFTRHEMVPRSYAHYWFALNNMTTSGLSLPFQSFNDPGWYVEEACIPVKYEINCNRPYQYNRNIGPQHRCSSIGYLSNSSQHLIALLRRLKMPAHDLLKDSLPALLNHITVARDDAIEVPLRDPAD